jgi:hypothetical protein
MATRRKEKKKEEMRQIVRHASKMRIEPAQMADREEMKQTGKMCVLSRRH